MTEKTDRFKLAFERLDAIMSIEADEPERTLVEYKPMWSGSWVAAMTQMSAEEQYEND